MRYLYDAHQGVTKTRENAASLVWRPGLSHDIDEMVRNCNLCSKYRKKTIEPMRGTAFPKRPWSRVGADFFNHKGHMYLLVIDYFSRDVEICLVSKSVNTSETVLKMKKVFSRHGICDTLFSDNGPQFDSDEFKQFLTQWGCEHITSSPGYAQSNGEAERAVQTVKSILNKCDDEYLALLNYRNTPLHNGYSPAQLSMGRKLRTRIPCHPDELLPKLPDYVSLQKREIIYRERISRNYDRKHRVVEGEQLSPGDKVWIPDQQTEGTVVRMHSAPRSVLIQTPKSTVRRNRRMARGLLPPTSSQNMQPQSKCIAVPTELTALPEGPGPVESSLGEHVPTVLNEQPETLSEPRRSERMRRPPRRYVEEY
ncbi:PREDICTED: uncharacterized protein K02A2.6-like [Priapulus caudatus]|uniref:RNA-directed DNA polymerase n=1 Tax=Priapulus caudatus TaxID=37621 RepID=A0ABM1E9R1_PRICU|nr:PREDICTED: uncharacterized protein K02A2.6-like [Priapulus caudatus]